MKVKFLSGLSWTELHQITWEQLLHIFEKAIEYQAEFALPIAYQSEPKGVIDYLNRGLKQFNENSARKKKMTQEEFDAKMKKMREKMKKNPPLTDELKQKIRAFSKHLKSEN